VSLFWLSYKRGGIEGGSVLQFDFLAGAAVCLMTRGEAGKEKKRSREEKPRQTPSLSTAFPEAYDQAVREEGERVRGGGKKKKKEGRKFLLCTVPHSAQRGMKEQKGRGGEKRVLYYRPADLPSWGNSAI